MLMKPLIPILIAVVAIVIFGLLVTETIDLRPDSTGVRHYTDLKQNQNEWIAENCVDELCNDGQNITNKIAEFIEINENYFGKTGFNMYGYDKNGMDRQGRNLEQQQLVHDAYVSCISSTKNIEGCSSYGDTGLCEDSNKSLAIARCEQQSRTMNEDFKTMNENLQKNP